MKMMDNKVFEDIVSPDHVYLGGSQSDVVFEDYLYYASLQRQEEEGHGNGQISPPASETGVDEKQSFPSDIVSSSEKIEDLPQPPPMTPDEMEHANASRALRLASWGSVFYLITTDILGPFSAPFSISQVGWVPGVILYFF
ncbi:hypothetical protein AX15_002838, partial [Amanita polypyramis BW_CC]